MQILHNHIGLRPSGPKIVIVQTDDRLYTSEQIYAEFIEFESGTVVHRQTIQESGRVAGWTRRFFHLFDFTDITQQGRFFVRIIAGQTRVNGHPFIIDEFTDTDPLLSDIIHYFKGQRCSGRWNETDRHAMFFGGREGTVDVHGGWYDAAGDYSKYLSHLSYANYFNPQQTPLVVWALFGTGRILEGSRRFSESLLAERTLEEAWWGTDFLMRMQDEQGYFYMTLFDTWSKKSEKRMISAFKTQQGELLSGYEAGFRQGGGMAIAALARASGFPRESIPADGYTPRQCLQAASTGYKHLVEHNREYLDNGRENIIDFYCALTAAVELYHTTGESYYLEESRRWFGKLKGLFDPSLGAWRVEPDAFRPYFHASDTGLLHMSLISYAAVEQDKKRHEDAVSLIEQVLSAELSLSERVFNPFSLSRQVIQPVDGEITDAFFVAHDNETGYWWQGENARLASVAAGCRAAAAFLMKRGKTELADSLNRYAQAQLDWVLGCNPFDICMMQGQGRNNPLYENHYPNAPGGICNGITAGYHDESDIAFLPPGVGEDGDHRWRWSEQWIPHAAWFALAAAMELK